MVVVNGVAARGRAGVGWFVAAADAAQVKRDALDNQKHVPGCRGLQNADCSGVRGGWFAAAADAAQVTLSGARQLLNARRIRTLNLASD